MTSREADAPDETEPSGTATDAPPSGSRSPAVVTPEWIEISGVEGLTEEVTRIPMTGISELDDEHARLIRHYNALLRGMSRHRDANAFALSFHSLVYRVRQHFEHEEALMRRVNYSGYQFHRMVHKKLLSDAQRFLMDLIGRQERDRCLTVANWFRHWLINHIMTHDRKIGEFLADDIWTQ